MASFTNMATLSYNGSQINSNVVTGELQDALTITKTAVSGGYRPGDTVTYVVTLSNTGTAALTGLTLTDDLGGSTVAAGTVYPLAYVPGSVLYYNGGTAQPAPTVTAGPPMTVTGVTVPAGSNVTLVYQARVTEFAPPGVEGEIRNTVTASGGGLATPLTATATTAAQAAPELSISKALCPAVVTGNGPLTYTFTVQNTGNQIGCVLLYYILKSRKALGNLPADGAVVKSVVSTELARKIAESFGLVCFNTLTGFKWIAEKIQQFQEKGDHTFVFGFEESYGFLSSTFVRDKDGVNASLLIAEAAAWAKTQGKTLYDILQEIYKTYGYYVEKVVSVTLPGKDGVVKMKEIMKSLRENPLKELAGKKVLAVRDYLADTRTDCEGHVTPAGLPKSDVLYFELVDDAWVCIRPSGTEPKIKLYVNTNAKHPEDSAKENAELVEACKALMA